MKNFIYLAFTFSLVSAQTQAVAPFTSVDELAIAPVNITKTVAAHPSVPSIIPPVALGVVSTVTSGIGLFSAYTTVMYVARYIGFIPLVSNNGKFKLVTLRDPFIFAVITVLSLGAAVVSGYYTHKKRVARNKAKKELAQISTVPAVVA